MLTRMISVLCIVRASGQRASTRNDPPTCGCVCVITLLVSQGGPADKAADARSNTQGILQATSGKARSHIMSTLECSQKDLF